MNTLDQNQIVNIATGVATTHLGRSNFTSVSSASTIDSTGRDALQITIVLAPGFASSVSGVVAANTVFDMNKRLRDAGEERFSIVRYST
jgi:hypothetical protein